MSNERKSNIPSHLKSLFERDDAPQNDAVDGVLPESGQKIQTGRLRRAFKISKLAAGGGSKWLASKARNLVGSTESAEQRDKETGVAIATQMLKTFSEMRGVSMKMGQMLSYMDNFLPPEAQKVLALLQRDAPPMPWSDIQDQIYDELGENPEDLFADFDTSPLAAASIGQVHRATLPDGTKVAVKIQYPGIEEAMKSDLKNTKIMGMFQKMLFFRTDAKAIMKELEIRFLDECNYQKEAEYQESFYNRLKDHPNIVIPKVFPEFSSRKVLTTEFQDGLGFYEWLDTNPSPEVRHQMTRSLYRFYLGSLYLDGMFNCDPHPGNYIFLENNKIAFLDFGCCRPFPTDRLELWKELAQTVYLDKTENLESLAIQMGFFPEGLEYDKESFHELMLYLYRPYLKDEPFDFSLQAPETTFRRMFVDNPNLFKLNMPHDAVFLNRIGFGLVSILSEIGASLNCRSHITDYFNGIDPDWQDDPFL